MRNSSRKLLRRTITTTYAAILLAATAHADSVTYNFQTLNNPADPTFNQLLGINNTGLIVGYFGVGSDAHPNKGYTLIPPANYTNENFPASVQTQVVGVNSNASPTTVGFWVDGLGNNFGFVDRSNVFTSVSDPNVPATGGMVTQLLGVNNANTAVGFYLDAAGDSQGFSYNIAGNSFTPINLPGSFNAAMTTATGINSAGVISGFYMDAAGNTHGFLDNGGTFTSFDDPNANGNTTFLGLNDNGLVVGSFVDGAGVTNGLVFNSLSSTWQTVNDPFSSATPAFDVTGTTINGINNAGQLVGFYSDGTNVDGFAATPAPEPSPIVLVSAGFGLLLAAHRRRRRT